MLTYKIDVLAALKENGFSSYRLIKEKLIGHVAIQNLRENKMIGIKELNKICKLLDCQPGDIIAYEKED